MTQDGEERGVLGIAAQEVLEKWDGCVDMGKLQGPNTDVFTFKVDFRLDGKIVEVGGKSKQIRVSIATREMTAAAS